MRARQIRPRSPPTATISRSCSCTPIPHPAGAGRGAFGLYHFALLLPDRASLGRFVTHLAALGVGAGAADHLVSEALYLTDPDGLGIEVYADRPETTWRHAQRELAMASDSLDFAAVAAAGGGVPWTGAPAGTTMGHIHLHVGDLDKARCFYHDALGFDVTVWSYPGALFFSAGSYTIIWARIPGARGRRPPTRRRASASGSCCCRGPRMPPRPRAA